MSHTARRQLNRSIRHSRIRRRIVGSAERPRLAVFRSAKHIYVQAIDDASGRTLCSASTVDKEIRGGLKNTGNCESAGLVGKAIGEQLTKLGVERAVFDRGGNRFHGRVKALADSAREAGLKF